MRKDVYINEPELKKQIFELNSIIADINYYNSTRNSWLMVPQLQNGNT